ncbi:MAG TPA: Lrp/AsnC family transcriptional regulator [Mycobacteriales bacterium]|nr:Lrp/AsnC family transcriptional regulator [Mycobacteriales bacterium]
MERSAAGQRVNVTSSLDELDCRLLAAFTAAPRLSVLEASRRLGVARGTVQARLERLERRGVVSGWGPHLSPSAMGYAVTAFVTLEIRQGSGSDRVLEHLREIPQVLEAHTITGPGDLLCRVVARDNADLQDVLDSVVGNGDVERSSTVIALRTAIEPDASRLVGPA